MRARRAGLAWPLPEGLTDETLEDRLYPPPAVASKERRPRPDWATVHRELRRPGVTLQLLWEEHRAAHPDGYGYSRYCELYRAWEGRLSPTMRQSHIAGERMFVDYAGTTLAVIDGLSGEARTAQLFVAVLGALKPLPAEPYVFAEWKQCRVGLDYHVEIDKHYYSVPHQLLREKVWARITARTIEVFHRGKRVAAHVRSSANRKHTTVREHMPSSHRRYADWTPERLRRQADAIGRNTSALVEIILRERAHPEQGFRSCVGIVRLAKTWGRERLEAACCRALEIGARSYSSVNSILKNNLDRRRPAMPADGPAIAHDNIRGPTYFH